MAGKAVLEAAGDKVRVLVKHQHSFGYAQAELWDEALAREAYDWADTVIIHNDPAVFAKVDNGRPKNLIVHHHGSRFRGSPVDMWAASEAIGARQIVSTVDLLLSVPEGKHAEWMPQVIDVERMQGLRAAYEPPNGRKIRIAHAPTNRQIKGTRFVIKATKRLRAQTDFLLIQRQPWWVCLMWKASADIFIDQLHLGYGNNAIEAWAMGLPVLAGSTEPVLNVMRREFGGDLPFYLTTGVSLFDDLRQLIADEDLREKWAAIGFRHVQRFHAPQAWLERAHRIYAAEPVKIAPRRQRRIELAAAVA